MIKITKEKDELERALYYYTTERENIQEDLKKVVKLIDEFKNKDFQKLGNAYGIIKGILRDLE